MSLLTTPVHATTRPAFPRSGRVIGLVSDRIAGGAAVLAGALSLVVGALQFLFPQDPDAGMDLRVRLILAMFAISLWSFSVLFLGLARYARSTWGGALAAAGTTLLTVGTVSSAINGADLAFFPMVALPANAMWLVGAIALCVSLARARQVSLWLALPLPLIQLPLLLLSQSGGGVIAGAFLVILGSVLLAGRIASRRRRGA